MGMLTEDMTRLNEEIQALRGDRRAFLMQLSDDNRDRKRVARATRADRLGSIADIKSSVADFLSEVSTDLCGARQAWLALGTSSPRAGAESEKQTRRVAAANAKGKRSETGRKPVPAHMKRKH
jgi:uncharacterized membrane protein